MKTKVIVIAILVIVLGFTGWRLWKTFHKNSDQQAAEQQKPQAPSINGMMVDVEQAALRPLTIVVENHFDARPQSGLLEAEIVYETLAEGGITRFLAVFQTQAPKEIGPVRSARPYFNFLADMWHAPLVHAGGSKQALSELNSNFYKNLFDSNEFYYGDYFYRDSERYAPHNLYTTLEDQRKLLQKKDTLNWEKFSLWETQKTPTDQIAPDVTNLTIPFSTTSYEVNYNYDYGTNSYRRSVGNVATLDKNNQEQISPKNILVMLADIATNPDDDLGTQSIKLNNSGPCYLFRDGKFFQGKWEYKNNRHYYTDQDGNPLKLEPGQTWIEIFPRDRQNEIKWQQQANK